jgi:peptidoglycan/xylan/chitin deacetylase (PgdA/CDA1 family)
MQLKDLFFRTSFLYNLIPVLSLMKIAGKNVILPFYHFVDAGTNNIVNHLYQAKNTSQFIEDLHYFKKHFNSLSVSVFDAKEKIETNSFLLSFDDGLSNFYHVVAPILLKENVTAINF